MQLNRGEIKERAVAAASAVRARGGFEASFAYTPAHLCNDRVFVIDDARLSADPDESGNTFFYAELLFDAYIMVALPSDPCEHDYQAAEKAIDEMVTDMMDKLPAQNLRMELPMEFRTRKVRSTKDRNPTFTTYATAEFKIR